MSKDAANLQTRYVELQSRKISAEMELKAIRDGEDSLLGQDHWKKILVETRTELEKINEAIKLASWDGNPDHDDSWLLEG